MLRVALNFGNRLLAGRDPAGQPVGISVDIANALAKHMSLGLTFVGYHRAKDVADTAQSDAWDVCFLAVDPERAKTLAFSAPYIQIDGSYLAGPRCDVADGAALIGAGLPIGTVAGSAYGLALERQLDQANLVIFDDMRDALAALDDGTIAAMSGIRSVMQREANNRPGARVLHPPFMQIKQAMAVPINRPNAHAALVAFLGDLSASGAIAAICERHGMDPGCALPCADAL
ncbi:transporter substrate-binding domain-containing protein [Yoonia sp.]|uniref:transporter substrate-binding domain-containing protein n=1 Tax=Yoonia sp. TaxID=2212373 RepID=UPI003919F7DF